MHRQRPAPSVPVARLSRPKALALPIDAERGPVDPLPPSPFETTGHLRLSKLYPQDSQLNTVQCWLLWNMHPRQYLLRWCPDRLVPAVRDPDRRRDDRHSRRVRYHQKT